MSKAFTNEETPDDPVLVPGRAPLPAGTPNYVTPRGLRLLRAELADLEADRAAVEGGAYDDVERGRRLAVLVARVAALNARIATATVVEQHGRGHDDVRFGARVTLRTLGAAPAERQLQIVGVDEADPAHGRVAFVSPIARAILGLEVGEQATLRTPGGEELVEVTAIDYPPD